MNARRILRLWSSPFTLALFGSFAGWLALELETPSLAVASFLVGLGGAVLAHQRQKLEEARLFKELFTEFNRRYDDMNDRLSALRESGRSPSADDRRLLGDYFNLCAEEYLFASMGYIDQRVWRSWCSGMRWYLECEPIRREWESESKTASHYGLTLEVVLRDADSR